MPGAKIRKIALFVDETHIEMGKTIDPPTRRAAAVAVIENPFASVYQEDLEELMEIGAELGGLLGEKCVTAQHKVGMGFFVGLACVFWRRFDIH